VDVDVFNLSIKLIVLLCNNTNIGTEKRREKVVVLRELNRAIIYNK
jgi:hypothetical protein